ncbi:MAG: VOC family protein [Pseudomonadota bacterium]
MPVSGLDHVAVPTRNLSAMLAFYRGLGARIDETHAPHLYAAYFGAQKINLHAPHLWESGRFELRGPSALPGCGDFCFVWSGDAAALEERLAQLGAAIIEGPVQRDGGRGGDLGMSTYVRDPDGNLVELIIYDG